MRIMIDLRTGEPALGLEGEIKEMDISRSFYQLIDCLLHTPLMTEYLIPTWGVDYRGIVAASSHPNWESIIKYKIVEAVSPSKEPIIHSITSVEVSRNTNGENLAVTLELKSKYGAQSTNKVTLSE